MGKLFNLNGFSTDKTIQEVYSCPLPKHIHMPHHLASTKLTSSLLLPGNPVVLRERALERSLRISLLIIAARKRSLRRLCLYTCLLVILLGGRVLPQCMTGYTPPAADTPREADTPRSRHPLPRKQTPLRSTCWEIRATSGWYASY